MNVSLPDVPVRAIAIGVEPNAPHHSVEGDLGRIRQLRSLLALLALYAATLLVVVLVSDGADIGCILTGIAGHVLYASVRTAHAWREASWLEAARVRVHRQRLAHY